METGSTVPPDDSQPVTSTSLLDRARNQDARAWEQLVDLYTPLVYSWCRRAGLQRADSADIGQEVFRAVARKLVDFRRDREGDSFRGWLRTITRNKLRDLAANLKRCPPGVGGTEGVSFIDQVAVDEPESEETRVSDRNILFHRALDVIRAGFEERTWRIFWQVAVEDRSPDEVAREHGVTINAVYLARCRVLRRLREEFADLIDDLPDANPSPPD